MPLTQYFDYAHQALMLLHQESEFLDFLLALLQSQFFAFSLQIVCHLLFHIIFQNLGLIQHLKLNISLNQSFSCILFRKITEPFFNHLL